MALFKKKDAEAKEARDAAEPGMPKAPEKAKKAAFAGRNATASILRAQDERALKEKANRLANATKAGDPAQRELLHSSQLDERMRGGDAQATPKDRRNKVFLDLMIVAALAVLIAVVFGKVGIGLAFGIAAQTYLLALATGLLTACSFIFNTIRWRALRGALGAKVLLKAKSELTLTMVSVLAMFTVVIMGLIEVGALLVFLQLVPVGAAGAQFAGNFVLFQTIMLLVYLMALVSRMNNVTSFQPKPGAVTAAKWLTPIALFFVALGAVIASGLLPAGAIAAHQGVYIVTLGVLFEFMAMRIRLHLPSLWSLFEAAIGQSRKANEEVKDELRKRALRAYVMGSVFVALSMAFAGSIATGTIGVGGGRLTTALIVFYVIVALSLLGVLLVRVVQARLIQGRKVGADDQDELSRLVQQKRRNPAEIFRMAVYAVTGLIAAIAIVLSLLTGFNQLGALHEKYATDFFILAVLFGAGPYGYFTTKEAKRILAIDEKFPDFLRDIAESARAGMTLPRALVSAANGTYGALTSEIKTMAAQVEWGVDFADSLARFAKRTHTPLIDRTVNLIIEAQRAGGSVVEILTAASEDAREIKQIISERNTQMSMYTVVIYIAYFVFITVVLVLSAQFIPAFKAAVGGTGGDAGAAGQQVGGLTFKDFDPEDFNTVFFHAALAQAVGGGLVGGVLSKGSPVAGFLHIGIMMVMAWFSFRVLVGIM